MDDLLRLLASERRQSVMISSSPQLRAFTVRTCNRATCRLLKPGKERHLSESAHNLLHAAVHRLVRLGAVRADPSGQEWMSPIRLMLPLSEWEARYPEVTGWVQQLIRPRGYRFFVSWPTHPTQEDA